MSEGRRLRARRPPPKLRLVEHGDGGTPDGAPALRLNGKPEDAPLTLMRLGEPDLDAGIRAIDRGCRPDAVVTGLGERPEITSQARRLTRQHGVAWFCDPLLFRTALPGYRTARHLQDMDYAPGRDADPYDAAEFRSGDTSRRVARAVVGAQIDLGASGAWTASFVVGGLDDPWLSVNQALLRASADARDAFGASRLLAGIPLRLMGFGAVEQQRLLVQALAARQPDAYVLMLDGMHEESSAERLVSSLRLALLLQATGTPVILGRAGDLRRLFWAFGVRGAEFGLGRLLRFYVPDYRRSKGGPGPTPGPRVEVPDLCASLPVSKAQVLSAAGQLPECTCPACSEHGLDMQLHFAAEHDAHVVVSEARGLAGQSCPSRVAALDQALERSIRTWRRLTMAGYDLGKPRRHELWRRALDEGVQQGLLEPQRLADDLRLFDS